MKQIIFILLFPIFAFGQKNIIILKGKDNIVGKDFFETEPPKGTEYIISNPPYSLREKVLERLFGFKIPFAMLINEAGLFDSKKRYKLLKNNPFEIMVFDKRIDYIKDEEMLKGVPFKSIFLCSNVLPTQFTFEVLS